MTNTGIATQPASQTEAIEVANLLGLLDNPDTSKIAPLARKGTLTGHAIQHVLDQDVLFVFIQNLRRWNLMEYVKESCVDTLNAVLTSYLTKLLKMNASFVEQVRQQPIAPFEKLEKIANEFALAYQAAIYPLLARLVVEQIQFVPLKGYSVQHYYPSPYQRDTYDLDLLVAQTGDGWRGHRILTEAGCQFFDLQVLHLHREKSWKAHAFSREGMLIELHFGPIQSFHRGTIPSQIWEKQKLVFIGGTQMRIMAPESQVIYLCGHLHRHQAIRLRDLNDICVLLSQPGFDYEWLERVIQDAHLGPMYVQLLSTACKHFVDSPFLTYAFQGAKSLGMQHWSTASFPLKSQASAIKSLPCLLQAEFAAMPNPSFLHKLSWGWAILLFLLEEKVFKKIDSRRQPVTGWLSKVHDHLFPATSHWYIENVQGRRYAQIVKAMTIARKPVDIDRSIQRLSKTWQCTKIDQGVWEVSTNKGTSIIVSPGGFYVWLDYYMRPLTEEAEGYQLACQIDSLVHQQVKDVG